MFIPPPPVLTSYWRCAKYRIFFFFFKESIQGRETQHTMKALSEVMRWQLCSRCREKPVQTARGRWKIEISGEEALLAVCYI